MSRKIPLYANGAEQTAYLRKVDAQAALDAAGSRCHAIARELGIARLCYTQACRHYEAAVKDWLATLEHADEEVLS